MTNGSDAVELVPGSLFALGGVVPLDGRVSWVAPGATGYLPINCYLILGTGHAVLVDTGAGAHRAQVLAQLRDVLPRESRLTLVLTRTELDCALNLPAIEAAFAVDRVLCTGGTFTIPRASQAPIERLPLEPGTTTSIEAAPGIELDLHAPLYRLLPTMWVYDGAARALFTSDAFAHLRQEGAQRELAAGDGCELPDAHAIRADALAKFQWMAHTNTAPIAGDIRRVFADHAVDVIAPTSGRPIAGARLVRGLVDRVASLVEGLGP
jgi:flavorubredoxin